MGEEIGDGKGDGKAFDILSDEEKKKKFCGC